jgi:branched-chain amino acid transport system ATP-binding protein
MLEVKDIHVYYGLSHILFGVSLIVEKGSVVCLLGRNGAGKTTLIRSVIGQLKPRSGHILFKGQDIVSIPVHKIARMGMGYVPDNRGIFPDLTVAENLEIAKRRGSHGKWGEERLFDFFPLLQHIMSRPGGFCSGGEQQMLSIARALVSEPDFLLLDEPTEGLAPLVVNELTEKIGKLSEEGLSILMAEQNLAPAVKLANKVCIVDLGQIHFAGSVSEFQENDEIKKRHIMI